MNYTIGKSYTLTGDGEKYIFCGKSDNGRVMLVAERNISDARKVRDEIATRGIVGRTKELTFTHKWDDFESRVRQFHQDILEEESEEL